MSQRLLRQCKRIGVECKEFKIAKHGCKWFTCHRDFARPEHAAMRIFYEDGWRGASCEGGVILLILKSILLDVLEEINTIGDDYFSTENRPDKRVDAITAYLESQLHWTPKENKELLINSFSTITDNKFKENFSEIYNYQFVRENYPGIELDVIFKIYKILGLENILKIFHIFYENPYKYRKGWPDITMFKDDAVQFVEVKTSDYLIKSQVTILEDIILPMNLNFFVAHLSEDEIV